MKRKLQACLVAIFFLQVLPAEALIGWVGDFHPINGEGVPTNAPLTVTVRVWKDGCTNLPGPCPDLAANLYYRDPLEPNFSSSPMYYIAEEGNNDVWSGAIPAQYFTSSLGHMITYLEFTDLTDGSIASDVTYNASQPAAYFFNPGEPNVAVTLCVDFSCVDAGQPGISGSFNNWEFYPLQLLPDASAWCTTLYFQPDPGGVYEYKYRNPPFAEWESIANNRSFTLPMDGSGLTIIDWWDDNECATVDAEEELPMAFKLFPAYPNPFNPATNIAFEVAEISALRLAVYDLNGRQVRLLLDERVEAGSHSLRFDAAGLASGLYLLRMETGMHLETQKLMLLK